MKTRLAAAALALLSACGWMPAPKKSAKVDLAKLHGHTAGFRSVATCPGTPAPGLFAGALCVCDGFDNVGSGFVARAAGKDPANIGVNGASNIVGQVTTDGDWVSWNGIDGVGELDVGRDLVTTRDVNGVGHVQVGHDLFAGGNVSNVGDLAVTGTLRVAGAVESVGSLTAGARGPYTAPAAPPCPCDPATFLDVAKEVAQAKDKNDNAAHGLSTLDVVGSQDLTLTTGRYYFANVQTVGSTQILIDGAVALFLDGSLDSVGEDTFQLTDGSQLDLYVSGRLETVGSVAFGNPGDPSAFRLFVGGAGGSISHVGEQDVYGSIYAPAATFEFVGHTNVRGGLFVKNLDGVGSLEISYSRPSAPGTDVCGASPDGGSGGGGGGGSPDGGSGGGGGGGGSPDGGSGGGGGCGNPDGG